MKPERKDTRIHLVAELEKLPVHPDLPGIIAEAKAGEYHDYKNKKYDCGKMEVVNRLRRLELQEADELLARVISGEFDEVADEEDKAMMRKDIRENTKSEHEALAMFKVLGL